MSDIAATMPAMASVILTVRIDDDALKVLEWHARMQRFPLRSWIREYLEAEAERISSEFDLPVVPQEPVLGKFAPMKLKGSR